MFTGLIVAAAGAFPVLMLYGFGTMMDPSVQGAARKIAIGRMVVAEPTFSFAIILIIAGVWLMFHDPRRPDAGDRDG